MTKADLTGAAGEDESEKRPGVRVDRGPARRPEVHAVSVPDSDPHGDRNVYVLPGNPATVVCGGSAASDALTALENGLARIGLELDEIEQLVFTHTLPVRRSLTIRLAAHGDARVLVHPTSKPVLAEPLRHWQAAGDLYRRSARAAAVPNRLIARFDDHWEELRPDARGVDEGRIDVAAHDSLLGAGQTRWRVRHSPGPSRDHLSLYHEESASLISGELLVRRGTPLPYLAAKGERGGLEALRESWLDVARLSVSIAWPSHGPPIRAHRVQVARHQVVWRRRLSAARQAVLEGASTVWEVIVALGPTPSPSTLPAALRESISLLEWLRQRGTLDRTEVQGEVRYTPVAADD